MKTTKFFLTLLCVATPLAFGTGCTDALTGPAPEAEIERPSVRLEAQGDSTQADQEYVKALDGNPAL